MNFILLNSLSSIPVAGYIPLLLIFAASVAFLGSLSGVGGGVLHIPVMVWVLNLLYKQEFGINEITFISTVLVCISALINTILAGIKKETNYFLMMYSFLIAVPTIFLGVYIKEVIGSHTWIITLLIVVLLTYVSIQLIINQYVLKKREVKQEIKKQWYHIQLKNSNKNVNIFLLCGVSFFAAMITSLTGMGGGVIIMPFLLILVKLTFKESAPISHSIILITSLVSIIIESTNIHFTGSSAIDTNYFKDSTAMVTVLLPMFIGAIGGTIGAIFVKKYIKKEAIILWILVVLIWCSIVKMVVDLISKLI